MNPDGKQAMSLDDVESDWGYVNVREGAHMFWWLFEQDDSYKPHFLDVPDEIPVIVWLQVKISKVDQSDKETFLLFCFHDSNELDKLKEFG